jgi:hypothetical protein
VNSIQPQAGNVLGNSRLTAVLLGLDDMARAK